MRIYEGGEDFVLAELTEEMSLRSNLVAIAAARALEARDVAGLVDVYPSNACLMVRYDPDIIGYDDTVAVLVAELDAQAADPALTIDTRVVELPIWFDDPFTNECLHRFRSGHQRPEGDDLDFSAEVNGLTRAEFLRRYGAAPWFVSSVGFVAGLPELYQVVDRADQLQVPKYLRPRTDTPPLAVGHGGCFGAIYSVRGGGGYQLVGIGAAPIFDPAQRLADFAGSPVLFRTGDLVRYRSLDEAEYQQIQAAVAEGTFRYRTTPFQFSLAACEADYPGYAAQIMEAIEHA